MYQQMLPVAMFELSGLMHILYNPTRTNSRCIPFDIVLSICGSIHHMEPHTAEGNDVESKKEVLCDLPSPFQILAKYRQRLKRMRSSEFGQLCEQNTNWPSSELESTSGTSHVLSATSILSMARSIQQHYSSKRSGLFDYKASLSHENEVHVKRALSFLDAAESFSLRDYGQAEKLLCPLLSASLDDHPVERVITSFARHFQETIGVVSYPEREVMAHFDMEEAWMRVRTDIHTCEQRLPFIQITHFTAIQTVLDYVGSAERIHFIDFGAKLGSQWIILIHALATREPLRPKQLKISSICNADDRCEETGKLLSTFAESMNLPFVFARVHCEKNKLIRKDIFKLEKSETVAVFMENMLLGLSSTSKTLQALIGEIKKLNPCVIVLIEVEAETKGNFHGSLFHCSAMFDCLEACLERDNRFRKAAEQLYFHTVVKNFKQRGVIDFWRVYLARFGIVETDLSPASMCQARLLIRESASWQCCTLDMNGKSMILGWNGTPLRSVSAWKVQHAKHR